jgi:hypothetical protein
MPVVRLRFERLPTASQCKFNAETGQRNAESAHRKNRNDQRQFAGPIEYEIACENALLARNRTLA